MQTICLGILLSCFRIACVAAVPFNSTNQDLGHGTNHEPPDSNLTIQGIIPWMNYGCTMDDFDEQDGVAASELMIRWGDPTRGNNHIPPINWHAEVSGNAIYWICNCKRYNNDWTPRLEVVEARAVIRRKCGSGSGGWIYSKVWDKSYAMANVAGFPPGDLKCPPGCIWM